MPSTSRELKEIIQSDDETPLRRHSSRICKPTYRLKENDESEDDEIQSETQKPKRLVKPLPQDYDNDSDDEFLPTKPSHSRRLPLCAERFEVPLSRRQSSRFHDENDRDEGYTTRARSTRSRFLNKEETDQRGTRNLRKIKRWNYAKMLDVSGISSEEDVDERKPTQKFIKRATRYKSRNLRTKQKKNTEHSDQSLNDDSDEHDDDDDDDGDDDNDDDYENDDDDEENSVNIRVSVSSRGRIRKLTAEAKAHLFRRK